MLQLFVFIVAGTFAASMLLLVRSFVLFDRLLRILFFEHHSEWERAGRPMGFFWMPPGASWFTGGFSRGGLLGEWVVRAPPWISHSEIAMDLHRRFKQASASSRLATGMFLTELVLLILSVFTGQPHTP